MMALVLGVILASIWRTSKLYVTGSISTNTGFAPTRAIDPAVAKNVNGVVITSSPAPIPSANNATKRASVPDETPTPKAQLEYLATACSHSTPLGPSIKY